MPQPTPPPVPSTTLVPSSVLLGPAAYRVVAVSSNEEHQFSKVPRESIALLIGLGVAGDAHLGVTVQHRSRVARDPSQPNLRQVHLIAQELLDEARGLGFTVAPGDLGENVVTAGLDLLALPTDTLLHLGGNAVVRVTGLRNPCHQIDGFQDGLLKVAVRRDVEGRVVRRAGVMAVVEVAGRVRPDDPIAVTLPTGAHEALEPV